MRVSLISTDVAGTRPAGDSVTLRGATGLKGVAVVIVACMVFSRGPQSSPAEDWTGWRGPNRNGVSAEEELPWRWSETNGVRWKIPLPGAGISSPIVWRDRVVLTYSDGPDQSELHIVCVARDDGNELWHLKLWGSAPTRYHATKSSMASPTPVTDGEYVYAFFGTGDVFCVDADGGLAWHRSLAREYGRFENRFSATSSPLLYQGLVVLQCDHYGDSYVLAIDAKTGADRWKCDRPETWLSWSSPQIVPVAGTSLDELILSSSEKIDALDPLTGSRLWTVGGMQRECIPTPVFGDGLIYAVSGPNGQTLAIRPGGRGDVSQTHVLWQNQRGTPYVPSAILVGPYYYLVDDSGVGTCLDSRTGRPVWQKRFPGAYTSSPVAAAGRVYFSNEDGVTVVIRSHVGRYEELARNDLGQPIYASPAISEGHIFIRTAQQLFCIGPGDVQSGR